MSKSIDTKAINRGREFARRLLEPPVRAKAAQAAPARDLVLAIGDSWFNYWPRGDILDVLEDRLGHTIERWAHAGRELRQMLYREPPPLLGNGSMPAAADGVEISALVRRLAALTDDEKPRLLAILVSAGGNDVAGNAEVLRALVNRKGAGVALLNEAAMAEVVDVRLRAHYVTLLACITQACASAVGRGVPIVLHGYAHPVADGRGVLGQVWLKPVLEGLGYVDPLERNEIMKQLIDRLNEMQKSVTAIAEFKDAQHVDLRPALSNGGGYRLDWQNELHPTIPLGFGKVSAVFLRALAALRTYP